MKRISQVLGAFLLATGLAWGEPAAAHLDLTIPNMALVKESMRSYVKSGRYFQEIDALAAQAQSYLESNLPRFEGKQPAIVLDIDETTLSNYPHIDSYDFGYLPKEWVTWVHQAEAPALKGPLEFYQFAREKGVKVFFITGRSESQRDSTIKNLKREGFDGWQELIMRPNGEHGPTGTYKAAHRQRLTQAGYHIVVNMGDQMSDLEGGYADSTFKLPNPMYFVP